MKKIILLDPNFSADPISHKLLESGFKVIRIGKSKRKSRVIKHETFIDIDYSIKKNVLNLFQDERAYQIIPGCTDLSFKMSNEIGIDLNLPGYQKKRSIDHLLSKNKLSIFLEDSYIPHPKTLSGPLKSTPQDLKTHSWIVKPNIGFSGVGVNKIDFGDKKTTFEKIRKSLKNNEYILQEFVSGPLYSFSGILKDSKVTQSNIVLEECINENWKVDLSYIDRSFPTVFKNELIEIAEKISCITKKTTGLIHMQFILSDTGPKVIELIERMPGDLYSNLIEWSEKTTFVSGYLSNFLPNLSFDESISSAKKSLIRVTINLTSLQFFIKNNLVQNFELVHFTPVKRTTNLNSKINQEVVAFLNFPNDEAMKNWSKSDQKYYMFKN